MRYAIDGKYPIETKDQLTKTAAYFDKYLGRFHPADRVKIATTMEKRATELGMYLDNSWVKNYARSLNDNAQVSPDFHRNIEMRKHACSDEKANNLLDKIAEAVKIKNGKDIVDMLFAFDKVANLEYQWDKLIVDPVMTVFGSLNNPEYDSVKIAGDVDGDITNYELRKLAADVNEVAKLADVMGKEFQNKFIKDPIGSVQELNSLEKTAFCKAIAS